MRLKCIILALGNLCLYHYLAGQNQIIYELPHTAGEALFGFAQTSDGNYVMGYDQFGGVSGFVKIEEDGTPVWAMDYGFKGEVIQELPDQTLIIGGHTDEFGSDNDLFLMRTDANGNLIWFRLFSGTGDETLRDLTVTPTGCIVLAANENANASIIVKTDGAGNLLWGQRIPNGVVNGVENAPGNAYLFAGTYNSGGLIAWAFQMDSLGNHTPFLGITGGQTFEDVAVTADSTYLFFGNTSYLTNTVGHVIIRKPSTGYSKDYILSGPDRIVAQHIIPLADGGWVLTGWDHVQFNGPERGFAIRFDQNEQQVSDLVFYSASAGNFGAPWQTRGVATLDGGYAAGISFVDNGGFYLNEVDTVAPGGEALIYKAKGNAGMCNHLGSFGYGLGLRPPSTVTVTPTISAWSPVVSTPAVTATPFVLGVQAPTCFACIDSVSGSFSFSNTGPNAFQFASSSVNALSVDWDFGDGNSFTGANPLHTYANSGNYSVCMTLNGPCDTVSVCQNISVCNIGEFTGPAFICGSGNGVWTAALPASSHDWILDGITVGNGPSLTLTGLVDGSYSLIHLATDGFCTDSDTLDFYISSGSPVANFTYSYFNHDFTGVFSGTGPGAITWDFGDGNSATGNSVSHSFAMGDTFNICLVIVNGCGQDTFCQQIICPLPVADFSVSNVLNNFSFSNLSSGSITYQWDFGDGGLDTAANPSHLYNTSGTYAVQLIAENGCGLSSHFETIQAVNPLAQVSSERFYLDSGFEVVKMVEDPTGGFLVFGNSPNPGNGVANFAMLKLDSQGEFVWMKSYANSTVETIFRDAVITANQEVYLSGTRGGGALIAKMDLAGNVIWSKRITGMAGFNVAMPLHNGNVAFANHVSVLELTSAGVLVGSKNIGINISNVKLTADKGFLSLNVPGKVVKLDSTATIEWILEDSAGNKILDYLPLPNGNAVVAIANATSGTTINLKCVNSSGGNVWATAFDLGANCTVKLIRDPGGNISILAPLVSGNGFFGLQVDATNGAFVSGFDQTGSTPGTKILGFGVASTDQYFGWGHLTANIFGSTDTYGVVKVMDAFSPAFSCGVSFTPASQPFVAGLVNIAIPTTSSLSFTVGSTPLVVTSPTLADSVLCSGFCDPDIAPATVSLSGNTVTVSNPDGGIIDLGDGSPTRQDISFSYTYSSLPATLCNYFYTSCSAQQVCTTLVSVVCDTATITGPSGNQCPGPQTYTSTGTGTPVSETWVLNGATVATGPAYTANLGSGTFVLELIVDFGGCADTASVTINTVDAVAPVANCVSTVVVQLDGSGNGTITANDVNDGSTDNCGIASMSLNQTTFDCNDLGGGGGTADLFFSEYIEGSNQNKTIEIFNGTGLPVDLSAGNYAIRVYFNGATTYSEFPLSGTVATGDVFVFGRVNASAAILAETDQTTSFAIWTGDDAIELVKNGVTLDIFGTIGEDPGSGWSDNGKVTINRTLVRKSSVMNGITTNPGPGFPTLDAEWDVFPQDYIANLGTHTYAGGGPAPVLTLTVTDNGGNTASCTANYQVVDLVAPVLNCQPLTVLLDANGQASITPQDISATISDNCSVPGASLDISSFDCNDVGSGGGSAPTDLFISEYIEGSNQNKTLELYNGTASPINLTSGNYAVRVYFNGANTYSDFPLNGTVAAGDVFVFGRVNASSAILAETDQTTIYALWTGDDAIALVKNGVILDIFGRIGEDPGSAWSVGGNVTINKTLVRNANISSGVTVNPASGFPTLATEWTMYPQDEISFLGSHTFNQPPAGVAVTLTAQDDHFNISSCTVGVTVQANCTAVFASCPADILVGCPIPGGGTATVTWAAPTAAANCPANCGAVTVTQITGPASGSAFAQGTVTTITYVATIAGGISDTCSFDVIVPVCRMQQGTDELTDNGAQGADAQVGQQATQPIQVFPNPFRESVTFRFVTEAPTDAELVITDLSGKTLRRFANVHLEAGTQEWVWDATEDSGRPVTSGIYFYRLRFGDRVEFGKVEFVR